MERTWKPTTAGILSITAGAINFIGGIAVFSLGEAIGIMAGFWGVGAAIGTPLIILGITSIIGGIFAIKRTVWGLALAGAICALFPPTVLILGILSIIFVVMGKKEFA